MAGQPVEVYVVAQGRKPSNMLKYFINLHHQKLQERQAGYHPALHLLRASLPWADKCHTEYHPGWPMTPLATRDYQGIIPDNLQVPFPAWDNSCSVAENEQRVDACLAQLEELMQRYPDEIAGVVLEADAGAGGHRIAAPRFYQALSALCHR